MVDTQYGEEMIETREQYEELITAFELKRPKARPLLETIEALREVTRAAEFRGHKQYAESPCGGMTGCGLCEALHALPEWLLEE